MCVEVESPTEASGGARTNLRRVRLSCECKTL